GHHKWIELEALADHFGKEHADRKHVQADHNGTYDQHLRPCECAKTERQGRQQGQDDAQVWDQTHEPAEKTQKVKVGELEEAKHEHTKASEEQATDQITDDEALHHRGDTTEGFIGGAAVGRPEKLHRGGTRPVFPAQHEVDEKRYERQR